MLPFFRKIRFRLAQNNQFFKYGRYAVGEIVLVVVGILIALQINNWNERRKGIDKMNFYLFEVLQGLEKDKEYIESAIQKHDSIIVKYSNYREKFNDSIADPSIIVGLQIQALSGNKILIFPSRTTIDKISSVDYFDNELKRKLLELKAEQERLLKINEKHISAENQNFNIAQNNGWNGPLATLSLTNEDLSNYLGYNERWPDLIIIIDGLLDQKFVDAEDEKNNLINMSQRLNEIIELIEQELTL